MSLIYWARTRRQGPKENPLGYTQRAKVRNLDGPAGANRLAGAPTCKDAAGYFNSRLF